MKKILSFIAAAAITVGISNTVHAQNNYNVTRLYGMDRYKTSVSISNQFNNGTLENVIVASGKNFPDALAGSVLSKKLNAPILLAGNTEDESKECIQYIKSHLDKSGTVYLLGGQASINDEFINKIKSEGYKNFVRLGGKNRFDTNKSIVNFMNVEKHTPVVIVNAYGFADALSVSSIAASKGYPIIMTSNSKLSDEAINMIKNIEPSEVYIIGGDASVGANVISEIKGIVPSLDKDKVIKLAGKDRYETSLKVCNCFNMDTDTAVIANGSNFPDALSGSALATKFNAPIVLTDGKDITNQKEFLDGKNYKNIYLLGGAAAIDFSVEYLLRGPENITAEERDYVNKLLDYCDKYIAENTNTTNYIMNRLDDVLTEENLANLQDPNKILSALDEFSRFYKDYKTILETYRQSVLNQRNEAAAMGELNGLESLKIQYINSIDIEINSADKLIIMISSYESNLNNLKDAIKSGNMNKVQQVLQKLEEDNADSLDKIIGLEDGQMEINKLKEKLLTIKNMMN